MAKEIDTAQRRAAAIAIQLCEKWFDTGARASWCPAMANEFVEALQQARREALEEAAKVVREIFAKWGEGTDMDDVADAIDRLREGSDSYVR